MGNTQQQKFQVHNDILLQTTYKIREYFDEFHIENLRSAVHKLFTCAADGKKWEVNAGEISLNKLINILKELMEDGFQTLNMFTKEGTVHYTCGEIIVDPYIVGEKYTGMKKDKQYLRRIKAFQGEIQLLDETEVANIFISLKEFFLFNDRENWRKKLKDWKKNAKKGTSIHDREYYLQDRPVQTYFLILKFLESCLIISRMINDRYGISHYYMLVENDQAPFYVNPYGTINPFEEINEFFSKENATTMKMKLSVWMIAAKTQGKIWDEGEPAELIKFHERFNFIIETCWILHDSYYLLKDWLEPNNFSTIYPPIPEPSGSFRPDDSKLSSEEANAPVLFLENCLFGSTVVSEREVLSILLKSALSKDMVVDDQKWLHDKLPMMIDALYILNAWIFERSKKMETK